MPAGPRVRFWLDLAERTAMTFLQAFAAVWIVTDDLFTSTNLGIAATAGAIAAGKCLIAAKLGNNDDASALPASVDPATTAAAQAVAAQLRGTIPAGDERTGHEKLAALVPPPPDTMLMDDGSRQAFTAGRTTAKKAAAKKRT